MPHQQLIRVAVLIDISNAWGRRVIQGVLDYEKLNGPWDVLLVPCHENDVSSLPVSWSGDGIIAPVSDRSMATKLEKLGVPVVNISGKRIPDIDFPHILTDVSKFSEMAVEHFFERGFRSLAFITFNARDFSAECEEKLAVICKSLKCDFHAFPRENYLAAGEEWEQAGIAIRSWLAELTKPVGILAWGVRLGLDVLREAKHLDLQIPDEVAVLSEDDELLCTAVRPSISGVMLQSERIGFQAASMLDARINQGDLRGTDCELGPSGIVSRASTNALAIDDEEVADALRLIRGNVRERITVKEVVKRLAVSRRSLERRFRLHMQRSMGEEIARTHLDRAKQLLATTDQSIHWIAEESGYCSSEYMAAVLKSETGLTPSQFRKQFGHV